MIRALGLYIDCSNNLSEAEFANMPGCPFFVMISCSLQHETSSWPLIALNRSELLTALAKHSFRNRSEPL